MANTRIPHEIMEAIIRSSEIPPQMRVLHWYYRNMFGWSSNYKKGFFKVQSFTKVAGQIGIDKSRLNRVLNKLSDYGFFSIDYKKKEFHLSSQKVVKFNNNSPEQKVAKNDNKNCQKEQLSNSQAVDSKGKTASLKQSLKQDLKNSTSNNTNQNPFEIEISPIQELKHMSTHSNNWRDVDWDSIGMMIEAGKTNAQECYDTLNWLIKYKDKETINSPTGYFVKALNNPDWRVRS